MVNLLFICGKNKLRSPTAEGVFASYKGVEVDSAGVNSDAEQVVSQEQVLWADTIFVMEKSHARKLKSRFSVVMKGKKIVCLDIPDNYQYMQQELIAILERKVARYIK